MELTADLLELIRYPPPLCSAVLDAAVIRSTADDFQVEELPAYLPEGSGEHLFLWIEKRGLAAAELIARLARELQISSRDIGVAGQKDRHAVTRQFVSVPRRCEAELSRLAAAGITVLQATAHRHKLRTGHLRGNRFLLRLRSPAGGWTAHQATLAAARLQQLVTDGFPSYFGPQRFGHDGTTLRDGLALLQGRLSRKRWPFHQQRFLTRLVLSAVQSAVFNLVTGQRVLSGTISQPQPGDVVIRQHGSRPFLLPTPTSETAADSPPAESGTDESAAAPRLIPAGPLPGPQLLAATASIAVQEQQVLHQLGLDGTEFQRFARLCSGTRRAMLAFPAQVSATLQPPADSAAAAVNSAPFMQPPLAPVLQLQLELPAGIYATVLLRELCADVQDAAGAANSGDPADDPEMEQG